MLVIRVSRIGGSVWQLAATRAIAGDGTTDAIAWGAGSASVTVAPAMWALSASNILAVWWNPWDWSRHTLDVLTALGTAGAVVVVLAVALLGGLWRSYSRSRGRPQLQLAFDPAVHLNPEGVSLDDGETVR